MLLRLRRVTFLWGALLFTVTLVMLYTMLDTLNSGPRGGDTNYQLLESKLTDMEKELVANQEFMQKVRSEVDGLLMTGGQLGGSDVLRFVPDGKDKVPSSGRKEETYEVIVYGGVHPSEGMCQWTSQAVSKPDINMQQLLDSLAFDNPDGGVWKQGWPVTYDPDRWHKGNKLKVVLVPHTHCDPGWIKTFSDYYETQTKRILNNFVPKLEQSPHYKFMFSEMSYFSWWWAESEPTLRDRVRRLVASGQFEISTGGWVMPDEANAHYFAMLDQLIEGHQWLNSTLGFVPVSGWSIDPFGYSSTMAYLLRRSALRNMLIQRVHYSVKKHLARQTSLEFMWRQHWDSSSSTDMFTHLMPFYSYDVPHTCGPEPAVCCQFDFRRLPGSAIRCPWHIDPKPISDRNVAERAATITDQWKKKASLYKTGVVLVPLGDDFRYQQADEFDLQFGNYEKIFHYLDQHPEIGVQAKFGTLTDYFTAVYEQTGTPPGHPPPQIPSLSGDFFSYADRDDHYWTGYFTSRPLQKSLDRTLEHNLRSAEIIFSLAQWRARSSSSANFPSVSLMRRLVESRRTLGLFQHHDAITGTAKDFVVVDYGRRLLSALHNCKRVIIESCLYLAARSHTDYRYMEGESVLHMDETRASHDSLPERPVLVVTETPRTVLVYNSLGQPRTEVVTVHTSWPHVEVTDPSGQVLHSQTQPYWTDQHTAHSARFKVMFVADLPGVSVSRYSVRRVAADTDSRNHLASVTFLSPTGTQHAQGTQPFPTETVTSTEDFTLDSNFLSATFSGSSGLLQAVKVLSSGQRFESRLEFIQYGTVAAKDKSGAYLFLPDGDAKPLVTGKPELIRVIRGPICQEVHVYTQYIQHVMRVHNSPGTDGSALDMYNIVDIRGARNKEVGVRIHTDIKNQNRVFYSDLNGFQMQRRKYRQKLTLQGNVYPMPTMAYLQDSRSRLSVLTAQSSGVANLHAGAIDVMFDRRLNQDDNRGLGQGVLDNHPTPNRFRLLFEARSQPVKDAEETSSFPSLLGHLSSLALIHPMFLMPQAEPKTEPALSLSSHVSLLGEALPCELHLLNLRTLQNSEDNKELRHVPKDSSLLLLRHLASDCSFPAPSLSCSTSDGKVTVSELFSAPAPARMTQTSLTMNQQGSEVRPGQVLHVPPMEIAAVKMDIV